MKAFTDDIFEVTSVTEFVLGWVQTAFSPFPEVSGLKMILSQGRYNLGLSWKK